MCISNRRPTATLTESELNAVLPKLAEVIQEMADEKIGNWQRSDFTIYGHWKPTTGRRELNPGSKQGQVSFERGVLIRVPSNDLHLVEVFEEQYFATNTRVEKALKFTAWFVIHAISHYKLWGNQSKKLSEYFSNSPNEQWLEPRYLAFILGYLVNNIRQSFINHLQEIGVDIDEIIEAKSLMGKPYNRRLGDMHVRIRPAEKQPKHGRHVTYEVLASSHHRDYSRERDFDDYAPASDEEELASIPF